MYASRKLRKWSKSIDALAHDGICFGTWFLFYAYYVCNFVGTHICHVLNNAWFALIECNYGFNLVFWEVMSIAKPKNDVILFYCGRWLIMEILRHIYAADFLFKSVFIGSGHTGMTLNIRQDYKDSLIIIIRAWVFICSCHGQFT